MAALSYRQSGLILAKDGSAATEQQTRDLQRHLRSLGYLKAGIDGKFGDLTTSAVQALQYDLLHHDGKGLAGNGDPPVKIKDYNRGRVTAITGVVDQALVECLADIIDDPAFPKLPRADNPTAENQKVRSLIDSMPPPGVPLPFLKAILKQESSFRHYHVPADHDEDTFITIGLDRNDQAHPEAITSRGYGVGQYTLFHHPPHPAEIEDYLKDPIKNLQRAIGELRDKFEHFILGPSSGTQANDRLKEHDRDPLRWCTYAPDSPLYLSDCKACALQAGALEIVENVTPWYEGCDQTYQPTQYYRHGSYKGVPIRKNFPCDWPFAVRRYNGSGMNSYHYQAIILLNLLVI
jgi:peptidoglycan hydrolase-like protein with peptidoglycan-binding domain